MPVWVICTDYLNWHNCILLQLQNYWQSGLPKVPNLGKPLYHQGLLVGYAPLDNSYAVPSLAGSQESNQETNGFVTVEEYRYASSGNRRRLLELA